MESKTPIKDQYKKEEEAFWSKRRSCPYCPMHVLLACACGDCPVEPRCVHGNPESALGINHQTLVDGPDGEKQFVFRPYKTSFSQETQDLLQCFCDYFKLKLEILDVNTYSEEVEGQTHTVRISTTNESLCFRGGRNFSRRPWYGKGSPLDKWRQYVKGR